MTLHGSLSQAEVSAMGLATFGAPLCGNVALGAVAPLLADAVV